MYRRFLAAAFALATVAATQPTAAQTAPAGARVATPDQAPAADAYTNVTPTELRAMLAAGDPVLVNVHVPFEGDLPGTDLSIPFDAVEAHLERLPADRTAPIVLYCRSGRMSEIAAGTLRRLGYTRLYNLAGGFNAWAAAGLPMERD